MKLAKDHIEKFIGHTPRLSATEMHNLLNQMGAEVEGQEVVGSDVVFDVEITPNRPDLLGYVGLAREIIAAIRAETASLLHIEASDYSERVGDPISVRMAPDIVNDCPLYIARAIRNVQVKPSSQQVQALLVKHGIQPVNNIVDLANVVMLETGHPLHVYDADRVQDGILVRYSTGETFLGLNNKPIEAALGAVLITDTANTVLALAGVIGAKDSAVSETTKNIIIESAYFDPRKVRSAAKSAKTSTEASMRFERGADPLASPYALDRVTDMIVADCDDSCVVSKTTTCDQNAYVPRNIAITYRKIQKYLGIDLDSKFIQKTLQKLGFIIANETDDGFQVQVPSWRYHDVKRDVCLIEEITKVVGLANIPSVMPKSTLDIARKPVDQQALEAAEMFFVGLGFNQVVNYGFCSPGDFEKAGVDSSSPLQQFVTINAPLNQDYTVMRTSLVPGLLNNLEYNRNRGNQDVRIFELARTFHKSELKDGQPVEVRRIAGLVSGNLGLANWREKARTADFHDMKAIVAGLLNSLGIDRGTVTVEPGTSELTKLGLCANLVVNGKTAGYFGYSNARQKKGPQSLIFELDFDMLCQHSFSEEIKVKNPSKYPTVQRDLTFDCSPTFPSESIMQKIREHGSDLLHAIEMIDVYEDKASSEGVISLSFRIEFVSSERALTNEEVSALIEKMIVNITADPNVKFRQ